MFSYATTPSLFVLAPPFQALCFTLSGFIQRFTGYVYKVGLKWMLSYSCLEMLVRFCVGYSSGFRGRQC